MKERIENLQPGMILDQNIYSRENVLLMPKGTLLTENLIIRLLEFGVFTVQVKEVKDNSDTSEAKPQDKSFSDFNKSYSETVDRMKNAFDSARYSETLDITEFEGIVDGLIDRSSIGRSVLSYIKMIEQRDEYTLQHSINVSITSMLMGKWLGYSDSEIKTLGVAALLHDIGKIMVPGDILNKPGKLTSFEYSVIKNHPKLGYELLKNSGVVNDTIRNVVLTHHERLNGKGYPFGLNEKKISETARIVSICDVYDAVTSKRTYKPKENPLKGLKVVFDDSYNGLDPYLCKVFLNNVIMAYQGSNAVLTNGLIGKIIKITPENPTKPWIAVNTGFYDLQARRDIEVLDVL